MRERERPGGSLEMGTARVEAFSDGVMAVIITIMALELRAPEGRPWRRSGAGCRGCWCTC